MSVSPSDMRSPSRGLTAGYSAGRSTRPFSRGVAAGSSRPTSVGVKTTSTTSTTSGGSAGLAQQYHVIQDMYQGLAHDHGVNIRWGNQHAKSPLVRWSATPGYDTGSDDRIGHMTYNSSSMTEEMNELMSLPTRVGHKNGLAGGDFHRKQISERRRLRRAINTMTTEPNDVTNGSSGSCGGEDFRLRSGMTRRQSRAVVLDMMVRAERRGEELDIGDVTYTKLDRLKQIEIVKTMPIPLRMKMRMRDKLLQCTADCYGSGFKAWWYRWKMSQFRYKKIIQTDWQEFSSFITLWGDTLRSIEGHFGSGVVTYFRFLKWLFQLNILIFLLLLSFVVIPQAALSPASPTSALLSAAGGADVPSNTTDVDLLAVRCTQLYETNVTDTTVWWEHVIDFLQGTGFMELTAMFYGYYGYGDLDTDTAHNYNLPLAYLLTVCACFLVSLVLIVHNTARGFKERLMSNEHTTRMYCNLVFATWDYTLNAVHPAYVKHCTIHREITNILEEDRHAIRRKKQSTGQKLHLWSIRLAINLFVLSILCSAGYLIYYTTVKTIELSRDPDFANHHKFLQLLIEYMTSLTITALNGIVPLMFKKIVQWEDFSPAFEVNYTLFRTVFLRLSSLAVLIVTLYHEVLCDPRDECDVAVSSDTCTPLRCWETYVGQEIYKLVIMDFVATVAIVVCVEFPRRIAVNRLNWKIVQMVGKQQFDIPKNVLDLIYAQTLLWLGMFFSPMISAMCVIKFFIVFYLKMVTTLYNYEASHKPYRASESQSFFMIVLMTAYALCGVPVIYVVWSVPPSRGCGPYRTLSSMYSVVPSTVQTLTAWIRDILEFVGSAPFIIPLFVALCLAVYYISKLKDAYKKMTRVLKDQLTLEGQDKQFLMCRLQELSGGTKSVDKKPPKSPITE